MSADNNGRLRDELYPFGYRHMEDHEVAVAGESMCCENSSVSDPKQWTMITQVSALRFPGHALRQKWPHYTFAIKDPNSITQPIFSTLIERILSRKIIEGLLEGERVPALTIDEQMFLLTQCGSIEFEYY